MLRLLIIRVSLYKLYIYWGFFSQEIERCMQTEKRLIEEQRETEAESLEIQEFLQAEKSTMADTLKELELEVIIAVLIVILKLKN